MIKDNLIQQANGVFQWVDCQLQSLRRCVRNERKLQQCLSRLPNTLGETYERILCGIETSFWEEAQQILSLLCFSRRLLRVEEVIEAIAVNLTDREQYDNERRFISAKDLLQVCAGLIDVSIRGPQDSNDYYSDGVVGEVVRIAHFSVQEYLLSDAIRHSKAKYFSLSSSSQHGQLSKMCLLYLHNVELRTQSLTPALVQRYALTQYAARYWYEHYHHADVTFQAQLFKYAVTLFTKPQIFELWTRLHDPDRPWRSEVKYDEPSSKLTPTYYAALLGLDNILTFFVARNLSDINTAGGRYGNALQAASERGHLSVVQLLLDKGAEVNAVGGEYGGALQAASERGRLSVVQLLLDKSTDILTRDIYGSALQAASEKGHLAVVQLLEDHGAAIHIEEDTDAATDFSDVLSLTSSTSVPSLMSDRPSLVPDRSEGSSTMVMQHFAYLLFKNDILYPLYKKGLQELGPNKLRRRHDLLLKSYFKSLRKECRHPYERSAVRMLREKDQRREVIALIQDAVDPDSAFKTRAIDVLRRQKRERQFRLERFLKEVLTETSKVDHGSYLSEEQSSHQVHSPESAGLIHRRSSITVDEVDEDELAESDESLGDSLAEDLFSNLKNIERFLTAGEAFSQLQSNMQYLVCPPKSLEDAITRMDVHIAERYIQNHFDQVAVGDYEWLHELVEVGHSYQEIAELLVEGKRDSPWIVFSQQPLTIPVFQKEKHISDCAHVKRLLYGRHQDVSALSPNQSKIPAILETVRCIEELCGIGGLIPSSPDRSMWNGEAVFSDMLSTATITFRPVPIPNKNSELRLVQNILNALTGFCKAAALAQAAGLCCDCFTVLVDVSQQRRIVGGDPCILNLQRVSIDAAEDLRENIDILSSATPVINDQLQKCSLCAHRILAGIVSDDAFCLEEPLHCCALAVQYLCLGFVCYVHGHAGPLAPFFLDRSQEKIALYGACDLSGGQSSIVCSMVNLTCLGDMIHKPALAFNVQTVTSRPSDKHRYDVLTAFDDLLDTWGPGYTICASEDTESVVAIGIGGGYITRTKPGKNFFHWSEAGPQRQGRLIPFATSTQLLIGAPVSVNPGCQVNEEQYRSNYFACLGQIGTCDGFWTTMERQWGLTAGQYAGVLYNQTYYYTPGKSLKARYFQPVSWLYLISDLDHMWGLQVSLCTGVACRVRLRDLLADIMPKFIEPTQRELWQRLQIKNVIDVFEHGNLADWLEILDKDLQDYLLALVRSILDYLKDTGIDHDQRYLTVAWPVEGDLQRCLRIPCKHQTAWAQILADSMECATFACATTKCLVTENVICQGGSSWGNASRLLGTAFLSSSPLEEGGAYFIKKFGSRLLVRVRMPSVGGVPHLVVKISRLSSIPDIWERRLTRKEGERCKRVIREKQSHLEPAEDVIVRTVELL